VIPAFFIARLHPNAAKRKSLPGIMTGRLGAIRLTY
jgi:hypothetical protein